MRRIITSCAIVAALLASAPLAIAQDAGTCDAGRAQCLIEKYWPGDDAQAVRVATCESGGDHLDERANRPGSQFVGVFQIGTDIHQDRMARVGRERDKGRGEPYTKDDMFDAGRNTRVAWDLFDEQGWGPWEDSRSCWG